MIKIAVESFCFLKVGSYRADCLLLYWLFLAAIGVECYCKDMSGYNEILKLYKCVHMQCQSYTTTQSSQIFYKKKYF